MLTALSNLWLTLVALVGVAVAMLLAEQHQTSQTWALALPLTLFVINLVAAVITNRLFRRQLPLLVFHLSLLAVLLLALAGRLSYLTGQISLTENMAFTGKLDQQTSGPLHMGNLEQLYFKNEGFKARYIPGSNNSTRLYLSSTENVLSWFDSLNNQRKAVIGDDHPLILQGYRIYTASHKGFALQFVFYPNDRSQPRWGEVYLKSYPAFKYEQAQEWTIPDSNESIWCLLEFDEEIFDLHEPSIFRIPKEHQVVIRVGKENNQRHVLQVGESIELKNGLLKYEGLTTWMGYRFVYDWTLPWIAAASFAAVFSLAWFYWRRFFGKSWLNNSDRNIALFSQKNR